MNIKIIVLLLKCIIIYKFYKIKKIIINNMWKKFEKKNIFYKYIYIYLLII